MLNSLQMSAEDFRARAEIAFGLKAVASALGTKYNKVASNPVHLSSLPSRGEHNDFYLRDRYATDCTAVDSNNGLALA